MISFNPYMGTLIESKEWEENAIKRIDELESENARLREIIEMAKQNEVHKNLLTKTNQNTLEILNEENANETTMADRSG